MRTFLAIELPGSLQRKLAEFQAELIRIGADVLWVPTIHAHFTVKFLGETSHDQLLPTDEAVRPIIAATPMMRLSLSGTGVFPDARRPRVLWVGAQGDTKRLSELEQQVESTLEPIGFPPKRRCFNPHVTLDRIKGSRRIREVVGTFKARTKDATWYLRRRALGAVRKPFIAARRAVQAAVHLSPDACTCADRTIRYRPT